MLATILARGTLFLTIAKSVTTLEKDSVWAQVAQRPSLRSTIATFTTTQAIISEAASELQAPKAPPMCLSIARSSPTTLPGEEGALFTFGGADFTLVDCEVSHNSSATDGGGAYFTVGDDGASMTATRCTFSNNSAQSRGGAIFGENSSGGIVVSLKQSTIAENTANEGGGIYFCDGTPGRYFFNLIDSTVSANTALTQGGGFVFSQVDFEDALNDVPQILNFENSIIAGNNAPLSTDILEETEPSTVIKTFTGLTLFSDLEGSTLTAGDTGILFDANPLLSPLGSFGGLTETIIPLPGSPAIDAVTTTTATIDQRGFTRLLDGDDNGATSADLGSVEAPNYANPGPDDFLSIWLTDQDQDGSPWGLEQAIGTNPAVADSGNAFNLSIPTINPTGAVTLLFGHNPNALVGTTLSLTRSQTFDTEGFTTIFSSSFDGIFSIAEFGDQASFESSAISVDFLDTNPPSPRSLLPPRSHLQSVTIDQASLPLQSHNKHQGQQEHSQKDNDRRTVPGHSQSPAFLCTAFSRKQLRHRPSNERP